MIKAFQCKMCGTCCYGEGGIYLDAHEIARVSDHLGLSPETFVAEFCRQRHGKTYISTGPDGYCVFYDAGEKCRIHPVKPRPCTLWPFYAALLKDEDAWNLAKDACPGINRECSHRDFVEQAQE